MWGFFDGTLVPPSDKDPNYGDKMAEWSSTNQMILSWLFNVIDPDISSLGA